MRVISVIADIPVADLEVAKSFYTDFLGLSSEEFNLGWVARYTSPETGANLQLVTRDATAPEAAEVSADERRDTHHEHQDQPRRERLPRLAVADGTTGPGNNGESAASSRGFGADDRGNER